MNLKATWGNLVPRVPVHRVPWLLKRWKKRSTRAASARSRWPATGLRLASAANQGVSAVPRRDKLLEAARNHPAGLRFDDFETLMSRCGWTLDRQGGSHRVWYSSEGVRLPVQEGRAGKAKPYQVKQFLRIYEEENP